MMKIKKVSLILMAMILALSFSFTCFAEDNSTISEKKPEQKQGKENVQVSNQEVSYTATTYGKNISKSESEIFSTANECFAWIKGKGLNGIVFLDSNPKKTVGIELEGYEINFDANYILRYDAKKILYDKKVLAIQKTLDSLGFKLKADGYFGKQTREAVKQFQKSVHLTVDGVVGEKTYEKLITSVADTKDVSNK